MPDSLLHNAVVALSKAPEWEGVLAYDEFSNQIVTLREAPTGKLPGAWTDVDTTKVTCWLEREGIRLGTVAAHQAIECVARESAFHPVRDYLEALPWDGVQRVAHLLPVYFGAPNTQYAREVGQRWLISAVARIYKPGCQVDHVLTLVSAQGQYKSSSLRALCPKSEWFIDHISDLGSKDSRQELRGVWIIECGELSGMRRNEVERVKAFITTRQDHYRSPYGRIVQNFPRQCVFAATTNDDEPLIDATGNRRFWPVKCGAVNVKAIAENRDQLWAEAVVLYRESKPWWLETKELEDLARIEQDEHYKPGPWDDEILKWIANPKRNREHDPPLPWGGSERGRIKINDFLVHCLRKDRDLLDEASSSPTATREKPGSKLCWERGERICHWQRLLRNSDWQFNRRLQGTERKAVGAWRWSKVQQRSFSSGDSKRINW